MRLLLLGLLVAGLGSAALAQDSMVVRIHPAYGRASALHRFLLGENYRKEWSMEVRLPVLHVAAFQGGLSPEKLGGGMQSKSLRMVDKTGKEWVIRSVEKIPDLVVPQKLRETFARDLVDDATSAQNPFAALLVPPVAEAAGVPHTTPVICYIAADSALGVYAKTFTGTVALLEERSPFLQSNNSIEFVDKLRADNKNSYDAVLFLQARMIDLLFADWDRHEDQWRWHAEPGENGRRYLPIPRDRDQVVSVTEGVLPALVKDIYTMPRVPGFTEKIRKPRHYFFKSAFLNAEPASQLSHTLWTETVEAFVRTITDSVLEASLTRLPEPAYRLRHDDFLRILRSRRSGLAAAMEDYYRFINEIVDIRLTNKDEQVRITDTVGGVQVEVRRGKNGTLLMSKIYDEKLTREIRLYTLDGDDQVVVRHGGSGVRVRLVVGAGQKTIDAGDMTRRFDVYHDTAFHPVNLYNLTYPLVNAGLNADDGFLLGAGMRFVRQKGFRKDPYSSMYQFMLTHSFSSDAFKLYYRSEWIRVFGNTDITLQADINAPNNNLNFFGRGNETIYIKDVGLRYYRTRYSTYDLNPALRWRWQKTWSLSVGPALQYYSFDTEDNQGRFINNSALVGSYDSLTAAKSKVHLGGKMEFAYDTRKSPMFPTQGVYVKLAAKAYKGMGEYARDFMQIQPEFAFHQALNGVKTVIVSNRIGGLVSFGEPGWYQSAFLGGQGNLLGFRQYRFAGRHAVWDNVELHCKLADVSSYIFPGELGLTGFFDIGRVWVSHERDNSETFHNGVGGGIYYIPAQLAVFRLVAGHSTEGWYPYLSLGIRF